MDIIDRTLLASTYGIATYVITTYVLYNYDITFDIHVQKNFLIVTASLCTSYFLYNITKK